MTNDKELVEVWRKQFEEANGCANGVRYANGEYCYTTWEDNWQGFLLAKRAQPSVVLPKDDGTIAQNAYQLDVIAQLTAAGIKYTIGE